MYGRKCKSDIGLLHRNLNGKEKRKKSKLTRLVTGRQVDLSKNGNCVTTEE